METSTIAQISIIAALLLITIVAYFFPTKHEQIFRIWYKDIKHDLRFANHMNIQILNDNYLDLIIYSKTHGLNKQKKLDALGKKIADKKYLLYPRVRISVGFS